MIILLSSFNKKKRKIKKTKLTIVAKEHFFLFSYTLSDISANHVQARVYKLI